CCPLIGTLKRLDGTASLFNLLTRRLGKGVRVDGHRSIQFPVAEDLDREACAADQAALGENRRRDGTFARQAGQLADIHRFPRCRPDIREAALVWHTLLDRVLATL